MAVLRAEGEDFDAAEFLRASKLPGLKVFTRGDPVFPHSQPEGRCHVRSGVNVSVSEADFDDLANQEEDAIKFLAENADEIRRLCSYLGVQEIVLDFGIWRREAFAQFDRFPVELVQIAGDLGLALELSVYSRGSES
jgi:hypothetical protein